MPKLLANGLKKIGRDNSSTIVFISSPVEPFDSKLCTYVTVIKIKTKRLRKEGGNKHQPWSVKEKESDLKKKKAKESHKI